ERKTKNPMTTTDVTPRAKKRAREVAESLGHVIGQFRARGANGHAVAHCRCCAAPVIVRRDSIADSDGGMLRRHGYNTKQSGTAMTGTGRAGSSSCTSRLDVASPHQTAYHQRQECRYAGAGPKTCEFTSV